MTNETDFYPSRDALDEFCGWLHYILKNKNMDHALDWADHLIAEQDWSASRSVEVSGRITESGNPEFYTF